MNTTRLATGVDFSAAGRRAVALLVLFGLSGWLQGLQAATRLKVVGISGTPPPEATNIVAIAGGDSHAVVLRADGRVFAWGRNNYGQTNVPADLTNVVSIAAGSTHSLALLEDGTVRFWGNIYTTGVTEPPLFATANMALLAQGGSAQHVVSVMSDGTPVDWGNPSYNLIYVPPNATNIIDAAVASFHGLVLRADGIPVAWGLYDAVNPSGTPIVPSNATNIVAVACGFSCDLALRADGTVVSWGESSKDAIVPPLATNITAISSAGAQILALRSDGKVLTWYSGDQTSRVLSGVSNAVAIATPTGGSMVLSASDGPPLLGRIPHPPVAAGTTARFRALAISTTPLSYQWMREGTNLPGATTATLVLSNAQPSQTGIYGLVVSNIFGAVTNSNVAINVQPFLVQGLPQSQTMTGATNAGQAAMLFPKPIPPDHPVRLAIGWLGMPDNAQNFQVADLVTAELTGAKGLELVDRQSLNTVLRELQLSLSGLARAKDAVRVGKLLRADWFLLGTCGTVSNASPDIVARIVDARTGIMWDVRVFTAAKGMTGLASDLAGFVRQCRDSASFPKPRTFLGVGSFADVGINHRQAEFPRLLRAYLTRAYQPSQVTLLEREQVNLLLQEVRLDLAGLTDNPGANPPQPMQSAFWLVNGFYQSFESSGYEVELVLSVNRAFGRLRNFTFRGQVGEPLFGKIKDAIDSTLAKANLGILAPTRTSELRQQIELGHDLLNLASGTGIPTFNPWHTGPHLLPEWDFTKRRGYLTEAMRALETALLLEPESREAKYYLSACCCDDAMGRRDEGLGYLRELAGSPLEDEWSEKARLALGGLYFRTNQREAARWYNEAAKHSTNAQNAANYRSLGQQHLGYAVEAESAGQNGVKTNSESAAILEARLFEGLQGAQDVFKGKSGTVGCSYPLERFMGAYGTNQEAGARRLLELLPTMIQKFPDLAPHVLSAVAAFQVDTNSPVIAEFRKSLAACAEHPEQVLGCSTYFQYLFFAPYEWCMDHKLYSLAVELVEAKRHASLRRPEIAFDERDKVRLAFAYLRLQSWREALSVLENLGDVSIVMQTDGPWGAAFTPFVPARQAALCREKLGLPPLVKAGRFTMEKPSLCLHSPSTFAASPDSLWVAIGAELIQLGFDLHTNKVVRLPIAGYSGITSLCLGSGQFWIGTAGEGLVEYDKSSGKSRLMTEKDGLLLNNISALCLQERTLWIGFGRQQAGGLGSLDLRTGRLSAFTPPLPLDPLSSRESEAQNEPPRHAVTGLAVGLPDELWMLVAGRGLSRYHISSNAWDTSNFGNGVWLKCFGINGDGIFGGFSLAQTRLMIENERRPGDTNSPGTTERDVTFAESARLQADPAMRGRIKGFLGGSPDKAELRLRRFGGDHWQPFAEHIVLPEPPCLLTPELLT